MDNNFQNNVKNNFHITPSDAEVLFMSPGKKAATVGPPRVWRQDKFIGFGLRKLTVTLSLDTPKITLILHLQQAEVLPKSSCD